MNIDYWLIESQEDLEKFEMTTEIASPTDMARAIKNLIQVIDEVDNNPDISEEVREKSSVYTSVVRRVLNGENVWI